jgi:hypothetical protein
MKHHFRIKRMPFWSFLFVFACFGSLGPSVRGHGNHQFKFSVDKLVLKQLKRGPNLNSLLGEQTSFRLRVKENVTEENLNEVSTQGLLESEIDVNGLKVKVSLHATMDGGLVEVERSVGEINTAVTEWQALYSDLSSILKVDHSLEELLYEDGDRFMARWLIKDIWEIGYGEPMIIQDSGVQDVRNQIESADQFLNFLRKDKRAKIVLDQNKSGRPVMVDFWPIKGSGGKWVARHPMHEVAFVDKKSVQYELLSDFEAVRKFPEIKRMYRKKEARNMFGKKMDGVRVHLEGGTQEGYQIQFIRKNDRIKALVKGRKVTFEK